MSEFHCRGSFPIILRAKRILLHRFMIEKLVMRTSMHPMEVTPSIGVTVALIFNGDISRDIFCTFSHDA